ncbi:MAG TPA: MFS transporter [Ktedonobacterales bacterium]|nr:MFS transporter [Ktedonobacterales bacterium]
MNRTTTSPALSPTPAKKPGIFINGNFGRLWLGHTISVFGNFIFDTTLVLWIAAVIARGQEWAPLAVSGIFIAMSVPILVVGPIAGVFVDRWSKRGTMLVMDALRAVLVGLLILTAGIVPLPFLPGGRLPLYWQLGVIYAVVFLLNALSQFFRPASLALIGDIVPEETQTRAMGLDQTSMSIATILGPTLAAPIFVAFGPEWALGINALSFVVSFLLIQTVAAPPSARSVAEGTRPNFWKEFGLGLRYFLRSRVLVVLTTAAAILMFGGGALNTLDYFFVTGNLHAPDFYFGIVQGVMGVGMILGAILAGAFAQKIGLTRTLWLSLLGMAALVTVYARSADIWVAIVVIGLAGIAQAAVNVAAGPLILQSAPREMIGRVSSILNPLIMLSSLIGAALAGYLDSTVLRGFSVTLLSIHFGPVDTIFTAAGVIGLIGAIFAMVGLWGVRPVVHQPEAQGSTDTPVTVAMPPLATEEEDLVLG